MYHSGMGKLAWARTGEGGLARLDPAACRAMGQTMSAWYFEEGGLLLSRRARGAYFALARGLTLASLQEELDAPCLSIDAALISRELADQYKAELRDIHHLDFEDVDAWPFGSARGNPAAEPGLAMKDYLLLQHLSSDLRTALSEDLRGRLRPS